MKKELYVPFVSFLLSAFILLTASHASATLGGSVDSVESDRSALSGLRRAATDYSGYTVKEIDVDATLVREYVSPDGIVFGIAWNGFTHPDLTQLLGSYSGEYKKALEQTQRKHGNRRLRVKAKGVVVEKWGHMRNLQGRAYAPALIPRGVSSDEIK